MSRIRAGVALSGGLLALLLAGASQGQETGQALLTSSSAASLPEAPRPQESQATVARGFYVPQSSAGREDTLSIRATPKRLVADEGHIVTSPLRMRASDLRWLIPVAAATGATLATDTRVMRDVVSHDAGFNDASNTTSGVLRDAFIGVPVALYGLGEATGNGRAREAGWLAGEAMINAYVTDEGIKYITLRERPRLDNYRGQFYSGNAVSDPSFVSGHSIVAWSSAAVLAGEYSKPWQQIGIYTFAGSVSVTRVLAEQHFPSDVLLGAVSGWLIGHYVFKAHHRAITAR